MTQMTDTDLPLRAFGDTPQQRVLWMALFAHGLEGRRGLPYVLVGEPGTCKTSVLKYLARRASLVFEPIIGSLRSPMDYLGVPVPQRMQLNEHTQHLDPDGGDEFLYMHYAPAGFAIRAALAKRSLLLFDEANTAPPAVQNAMLRVLFEGVVGEVELSRSTRMLLAMNKLEDTAGGWDVSSATSSRMGWLTWEGSSVDQFSQYLVSSGGRGSDAMPVTPIDPDQHEAEVDARWGAAWARAVGEISGFLRRKPELFHNKPAAADAAKPWPNSRTWDFCAHALAGSYVFDLNEFEREIACGAYVGAGPYGEFFTWLNDSDLPEPAHLLDGHVKFEHNPARLDRTAAVFSAAAALVTPTDADKREERAKSLWNILGNMLNAHADVTDVALRPIVSLVQSHLISGNPDAYKVVAKVEPVMSAANLNVKDV